MVVSSPAKLAPTPPEKEVLAPLRDEDLCFGGWILKADGVEKKQFEILFAAVVFKVWFFNQFLYRKAQGQPQYIFREPCYFPE